MLDQEDPERIRVVEVRGGDPTGRLGSTFRTRGSASEPVLRTGEPRRLDEAATQALGVPYLKAFGPLLVLPLSTGTRVLGTLVVARKRGRRHFTEADAAMALDFAGRAGVALELHTARNDQERMLLFEERSRIARDLHDRVIQQLFATGMQLQSVLGTMPPGRGADRVDAAVSSLDAAIAQIRRVIFTLSTTDHVGPGETARQRLLDLLRELGASLSLEPALSFAGPVDGVVDAVLGDELLAVVTEAVTNAVKHAHASSVSVAVSAGADGLTVVVTNDGPPPAPDGRRSGLANLEERARRRGGSMVLAADGGRTALTWTVPLPESAS
jgi:signal transduction histidine kinase